jgi:hypothetical protein
MIILKLILFGIGIQLYFVYILYPYIEFNSKNFRIINNKVIPLGLKKTQFRIRLAALIITSIIIAAFTENYFSLTIIFIGFSCVFYIKLAKIQQELKYRIGKKFNLIRFFPYVGGSEQIKSVVKYYQNKEYIKAIALSDYFIQRSRNRFDNTMISFFEMRAQSLDALGYHIDAIEDYKYVLKIQPNGNNYGLLAMCYYKIGNWEDCMVNLEKARLYKSIVFSPMYESFRNLSEEVIEKMKLRSTKIENQKRRNKYDWLELFDENLIKLEKNNLKYAERQILNYLEFDPNNENLKKLLTQCNSSVLSFDSGYSICENEIMDE